MIRPQPADPKPRGWKKNVLMLAAVIGLFYFFFWHYIYRPDRARLEQRIAESERLLRTVESATVSWSEIEQEKIRKVNQLAELRRAVPEKLQVEAFLALLDEWAGARGVAITDIDYEEDRTELFERARIRFRPSGADENVAQLRKTQGELERLVEWTGGGGIQTLVIYAVPKSPPAMDRDPCVEIDIRPVPWPFSQQLLERREALEQICEELDQNREKLEQFRVYQNLDEETEMLKQFMAAIKSPE